MTFYIDTPIFAKCTIPPNMFISKDVFKFAFELKNKDTHKTEFFVALRFGMN